MILEFASDFFLQKQQQNTMLHCFYIAIKNNYPFNVVHITTAFIVENGLDWNLIGPTVNSMFYMNVDRLNIKGAGKSLMIGLILIALQRGKSVSNL